MNAVSNEKGPTSMAFYIRPTGTQISRGFKVHNVITCEFKVQVVVSQGGHWVLFALGRHWVLNNGTWHVLLQSGNVFELGGIIWGFPLTGALNFASAASVCNGLKQIIFFGAFSIFESGGITKHLMTGPSGNSEFCFPSTSMFPEASPRGTLSVSGNQNSLFPLWLVIKCLVSGAIGKNNVMFPVFNK